MMGDGLLSAPQTVAVLENAPIAVYVSAVDNHELLYANQAAKELFLRKPAEQVCTCYHVAGFDAPCPFCHTGDMTRAGLLSRTFHHPGNNRVYELSGKIIDWDGRPAHIEYILDVTEKKEEEVRSKTQQDELQETISSIPAGLCVYRLEGGRIFPVFHNSAFFKVLGYSDAHIREIQQEMRFTGVHPDDLALMKEKLSVFFQTGDVLRHTFRVYHDQKQEYRWIRLEGSIKRREDGSALLYGVYSDVSDQTRLERDLATANNKMEDIINAIPGGVAIYRVSDIFETVYFSDGVPALSGYTVEEYHELIKQDAVTMTYREDTALVVSKAKTVIQTHEKADFEFRKLHRDGHIVWVRAQIKWIGESDGCPLLHCVFHNISDLKEAQLEMDHLVNSIPGGIASYRVEGGHFILTFFSDGIAALTGHTREEYEQLVQHDSFDIVYGPDKARVSAAARTALTSGAVLDVSYRMHHKNGELVWVHLNGRRMGPLSEISRFYAVFTGMSAEARLFQRIANETADGIYVIDKENYDLLYANESKTLFMTAPNCIGQKCYAALHGKQSPCEFCTLEGSKLDGKEHEMTVDGTEDRFYSTRFHETDWNGIPAYIKYVRDTTKEVTTRKEKERLEQYFQTVLNYLPGGVAVIRYEKNGHMTPEFFSDGFATMLDMSMKDVWQLYKKDAMAGVHPGDQAHTVEQVASYIASGKSCYELVYRLKTGSGRYLWVKASLSLIQNEGGEVRFYVVYHDMTKERAEQEQLRMQYRKMILQHYRTPDPNALIIGHCNITQNKILEIFDRTHSHLLDTFGSEREAFFTGLSEFIVEQNERQQFLDIFLDAPSLASFKQKHTEQLLRCFIKLPAEQMGRYVQFKVTLVETPDTGDITGILTVTDVTEQTLSDRILHQLSVASYDFVIDLDLNRDFFKVLTCNKNAIGLPPLQGVHSDWMAHMLQAIVSKDKAQYEKGLNPDEMLRRLQEEGSYTFAFSILDETGDIRTKNMTVSAVDLRLGRICLVRTDITDSMREQRGLLNMVAYTFELAGFINVSTGYFTMYTRQAILENLSPYVAENYNNISDRFAQYYDAIEDGAEQREQFQLDTMLQRLCEKPEGYDFVLAYRAADSLLYKQISVLWGDENHQTVCLVRADVTDMLLAERQSQKKLEQALTLAKEASQAKSSFLSAMSHDIRTPMNAIMGMTALAVAHLDDRERMVDCLQKISISSKHLLSLINDVLDMSKIEHAQIALSCRRLSLSELVEQLSSIMAPQARAAGLAFTVHQEGISHDFFYGDGLRINQIFINLLSNAIKFTGEGGRVDFLIEEVPPVKYKNRIRYRFTVSDTGIGMSEAFLSHLFEPFTRSENTAQVEGTGLGLSITKGLVKLMDGELSVESQVNRGSTFRVDLECAPAPAETEARIQETAAEVSGPDSTKPFSGRCFLVAEDNAINAEILCELLSMYGAAAVVKPNGTQVVQAFRAAPLGTYSAILMDIQMPEMNGYEATRQIRETTRTDAKTIPILAMTANAFVEDVQASLEAGMNAHITKPIDPKILRTTLLGVVSKQQTQLD